jgi:hypothetical protein
MRYAYALIAGRASDLRWVSAAYQLAQNETAGTADVLPSLDLLHTAPAPTDPYVLRKQDMETDATVAQWLDRLVSASNAQIDSWFTANVTTQAQAVVVLKTLVKVLAFRLR